MNGELLERIRRELRSSALPLLLSLLCTLLAVGLALRVASADGSQRQQTGPRQKSEKNEPAEQAGDPNEKRPLRPTHDHRAFGERIEEREQMVKRQIEWREVNDPNVLKAMRTVPRHAFMPARQRTYAYADTPLPIGHAQTISQPYIVAFMTEALRLDPNATVLEIGTGSGYQAAVCAEIAKEVYSIEIVEPLAKSAAKLLKTLGYRNVFVRAGDGYYGWPEKAPFDAIIGTAAAERIPRPLTEQLKIGGRMILPVEGKFGFQHLILVTKDERGRLRQKNVMPVRFVPMTGDIQRPEKEVDK